MSDDKKECEMSLLGKFIHHKDVNLGHYKAAILHTGDVPISKLLAFCVMFINFSS